MNALFIVHSKFISFSRNNPKYQNFWDPPTLKNKRVNEHLKGPRSDSVFIVLHLPYYPAGSNSLKC